MGYAVGVRVAITGSSGFIGRTVATLLRDRDDVVVPVQRGETTEGELRWDTNDGFDPPDALSGIGAVVHLAGENVGQRWTDQHKRAIMQSRVEGTRRVVEALEAASPRPRVLVSASGVGYYGDRGDTIVDETANAGNDFIAEVCQAWEAQARRAEELEGVRVVRMRFGVVLGRGGGALPRLLPVFRLGLGGHLSDGRQYMSWVHVDDLARAIVHALDEPDVAGAYNVTAPEPVTNRELTDALGRALHRPTVFRVPAFALKAAYGEMAGVLLEGQRVVPRKLEATGFRFEFRRIDDALEDLLG
jgi:hypothetical protein